MNLRLQLVIPNIRFSGGSLFWRSVIPKVRLSDNEKEVVDPNMK